ncbi:hypothetical protein [Streptomyces sp. cmx-18-6]|uniref:hypothetical protein n=1 Tax=Streptomyces sp. cmx-18-6 TaxID=2790930 RepID=UPI00397F47E2
MSGVGGVTVVGRPAGDRPSWDGPHGAAAGGGDLKHSDAPWKRAAGQAEGLVTHFGPVKGELGRAHQGLVAGAGALSALAELSAVRTSWERRIETARDECGSLAGKLRAVVVSQAGANEAVKSSFARVQIPGVAGER